jgi:hypothetical protein
MHYCEDKFERINLFAEAKTCCESEQPMPGCCDDVSHVELPNTDQQISDLLDFQPLTADFSTPNFQFHLPSVHFIAEEKTAFADTSPPIVQHTPIYIFCQVFLI